MQPEQSIELIENYLNNKLSESEKIDFEDRLKQELPLMEAFEKHQLAHRALDYLIAKDLKEQLVTLENENKVVQINQIKSRKSVLKSLNWIAIAASVAILIGFFYYNFTLNDGIPSNELADSKYSFQNPTLRNSSGVPIFSEALENGLLALEEGRFDDAISLLRTLDKDDEFYLESRYFLGHAYYNQKAFAEAEVAFALMKSSNDIRYNQKAGWYELLSCLAQEKSCLSKLDQILSDEDHPYFEEANSIKSQLR